MTDLVLGSVFVGFVTGALTKVMYSAVRDEWPDSYVYTRSQLQKSSRTNLAKYLAFRGTPLLVAAFLGSSVTYRMSLPILPFGLSVWLAFSGLTWVPYVVRSYKLRLLRRGTDAALAILRAITSVIPVSFGTWLGTKFPQLAPAPTDLVTALWTALFVAVFATAAKNLLSTRRLDAAESVELAKKDVGESWESIQRTAIQRTAEEIGVEPAILESIVTIEVHQRPRWFRRLERVAGRFRRNMTHGIAQMRSERPISDAESVRLLAQDLKSWPEPTATSVHDRIDEYGAFLNARGATEGYVDEVRDIYFYLFDPSRIIVKSTSRTDIASSDSAVITRIRGVAARLFLWAAVKSAEGL